VRSKERLIEVCESLNIHAIGEEDWMLLRSASGAWDQEVSPHYLLLTYGQRLSKAIVAAKSPHVRELAEELLESIEQEHIWLKAES
jgi:hypothetical protein